MSGRGTLNLRQISALCGFSTCTVSRVLSGRARDFRITEETERRILTAAQEAGYRPNYLAHSLNTGRTHTIGLLLANRVDSYLGGILEGAEARLRGTPNRMVVATCENDPNLQRLELEGFAYRQVDGILLYPLAQSSAASAKPATPMVALGRVAPWRTDEVMLNDEQVAREAATRALKSGARTFGLVTNRTDCSSDRTRVETFKAEIRRAGFPAKAVRVMYGNQLPDSLSGIQAIFGINSGLLIALLARCRESAEKVRNWVSIGEIEGRDLLPVRIETLPMPSRELGRQAADLLLWRLDHPGEPLQRRIVNFS